MSKFSSGNVNTWNYNVYEEREIFRFLNFTVNIEKMINCCNCIDPWTMEVLCTPSENEQFNKIKLLLIEIYECKKNSKIDDFVNKTVEFRTLQKNLKDKICFDNQPKQGYSFKVIKGFREFGSKLFLKSFLNIFKESIIYNFKNDKYLDMQKPFLDFKSVIFCIEKFSDYVCEVMHAIIGVHVTPHMKNWLNTPLSDKRQDEFRLILREMEMHRRNAHQTELLNLRYKLEEMILDYVNFDKKNVFLESSSEYDVFCNARVRDFNQEYNFLSKRMHELQIDLEILSHIIKKPVSGGKPTISECAYLRIPLLGERLNEIRLLTLQMYECGDKNLVDECIKLFNDYVLNDSRENEKSRIPVAPSYSFLPLNDHFKRAEEIGGKRSNKIEVDFKGISEFVLISSRGH